MNLTELKLQVDQCIRCKLATTRTKTVFGTGNEQSKLIIVGEGPGKQEDLTGIPFSGRSGNLLDQLLKEALSIDRSDLYIANLVKCRPTVDLLFKKDRAPEPDELNGCLNYLWQQIEFIRPDVVLTLGAPASRVLRNENISMTKMREKPIQKSTYQVFSTWHPSYILRNGGLVSIQYQQALSDLRSAWGSVKKS